MENIKITNKKKGIIKYLILILILLILLSLCFLYGFIVGAKGIPPFDYLMDLYKQTKKTEKFETIDSFYLKTDVNSLISINNEEELVEKRNALINLVWSNQGFPMSKMPENIEKNIKDERYLDIFNLERIDRMTVLMDYGLNSIIYHFHPIKKNNKLIIYHQGHAGDFINGKKTIAYFLDKGFSVLAFSMPLSGMNNQPEIELERLGNIKIDSHEKIKFLQTDQIHPMKFFLEPIAVSLNAVATQYDDIYMVGISGGGWSTTLYSAIDQRILRSYPVAGSLPIYLRDVWDFGDYEQTLFDVYQITNYLELYILGSYGDNRKQIQILNKYDSVFFGIKYQTYEEKIKEKVFKLGKGEFEVYLDDSHKGHIISDDVLSLILNDIEN